MSKLGNILFAVLPAFAFAACASEADAPPTGSAVQLVQTLDDSGAVVKVSESSDGAELGDAHSRVVAMPSAVASVTSGCTHIQFCNAPGPDTVVCITNDKTTGACTPQAREDECISDSKAVCGAGQDITFKPPIPLPCGTASHGIPCD